LEFYTREGDISTGIGAGIFFLITTYFLAFALFGRLAGIALVLLIGELLFISGSITLFFRRGYRPAALVVPIAAGIVLSAITVTVAVFIGITLIHIPLHPPDSAAGDSGNRVLAIAVRTDTISTPSSEAKKLLTKGLVTASRNNEFGAAIGYYDQALAIDPNFIEAWMAKGVALHNLESYAEAVDCLDHALAIDPENAAAWSIKGNILESWGRPDEADICHARSAEIDRGYRDTPPVTVIPMAPPEIITPNAAPVRYYSPSGG